MTTVYFVRHAQPNYENHDDMLRELTAKGLEIRIEEGFRERRIDSVWIEDFHSFCKAQWADFDYKLSDGETLNQVQQRNISALNKLLKEHP